MSSDSSEDENLEQLKEATAKEFINDDMFSEKSLGTDDTKDVEDLALPPSLRRVEEFDDQFRLFNVTPQFQNYVGKALSKKLDNYLNNNLSELPKLHKKEKKSKNRIKLLASSKKPIDIELIEISKNTHKSKPNILAKQQDVISESELRAISVSGEDILNLKGIKHWSNRSKAPVFKYNFNNGIFHFVEPQFK